MEQGNILVVGAGQAGLQVAETLRHEGFEGPITLLGEEAHVPYNRPPLSKKWLLERAAFHGLLMRGPEALQRRRIDVQVATRVVALDRARREVHLGDGRHLSYTGLALCTGARLRSLPLPGSELAGVFGLRTVDEALAISAAFDRCLEEGRPLVVIGGGFIGLEVAASARKRGLEVLVLEGLERLMSRVVAPIISDAAARLHAQHGVRIVLGAKVSALLGAGGRVTGVRTAEGAEYPAGCVIVGVGVIPEDRLAASAGLACEHGIVVDACGRTADPLIVAAGDCTARRTDAGALVRLESVQNAVEMGRAAACALLGREHPFTAAPWFWSDQYDVKLQMVGQSHGYDQVVTRGDPAALAFSAYYFRQGTLIAVDSLSRVHEHMTARKLLDQHVAVTPAQVADMGLELAQLIPARVKTASPGS